MVCPCGFDAEDQSLHDAWESDEKPLRISGPLRINPFENPILDSSAAAVFALLGAGSLSVLAQSAKTYYKRGQAAEAMRRLR